jgi:hypothetical protein
MAILHSKRLHCLSSSPNNLSVFSKYYLQNISSKLAANTNATAIYMPIWRPGPSSIQSSNIKYITACITKAENIAKKTLLTTANKDVNVNVEQSRTPLQQANVSGEVENTGQFQSRLKALELPVFDGNKAKFKGIVYQSG